jgi:hypothetical protein
MTINDTASTLLLSVGVQSLSSDNAITSANVNMMCLASVRLVFLRCEQFQFALIRYPISGLDSQM